MKNFLFILLLACAAIAAAAFAMGARIYRWELFCWIFVAAAQSFNVWRLSRD